MEYIKSQNRLYGDSVLAFVTEIATEVDTPETFAFVEFELGRSPALIEELFV